MTASERLEGLVGPMLAAAILDAVREELAVERDASERGKSAGWCSVAEAAGVLGVSVRSVYRQVKAGTIESRRVGERVVVARRALM